MTTAIVRGHKAHTGTGWLLDYVVALGSANCG